MTTGFRLRDAARVLRGGGLVLYPTEGVWGLGCDPIRPDAVFALLALKARPASKGLILIADRVERLAPYVRDLADIPPPDDSPTTWIVPASAGCPWWLTGGRPSLAVRITTHPIAASLSAAFGAALVSTSANPGGRAAPRRATQVDRQIRAGVDIALGGRTGSLRGATPIRVAGSGELTRRGPTHA